MKPFIKYPGGKLKEYPLISKCTPQNIHRYFEPFVGGGAIYFNIGIDESYINDKSEDLMNVYNYVKDQNRDFFTFLLELDALWKEIEFADSLRDNMLGLSDINFNKYKKQSLSLKNKRFSNLEQNGTNISIFDKNELILTSKKTALYMCVRDLYNEKALAAPLHTACFYFIREYCYSSMFRFSKCGLFNVPYGGRSYNFKYMLPKIQQMQSEEIINYFRGTTIFNLDFEEFICRFKMKSSDFIFLDPPYDSEFSTYDNNSFDKNEQIRLKELLRKCEAKWMLIIKKTDFIYDLYKDFNIYEYDKNYMVSFKNRNNKDVKHLLITNYSIEG